MGDVLVENMTETNRIDVCMCTFQRPSVEVAIESIARQILPSDVSIKLIIADNDETTESEASIRAACAKFGVDLQYIHAPARNISVARNACLDAATAEWLAIMDDDEVAEPTWLANLLAARCDSDIVFGVVRALYNATTPRWMVEGDFHSSDLGRERNITSGHAGNVLLRRSFVAAHNLRFDPAVGRSGGEDTLFFYEARLKGARMALAPDAVVHEPVPASRENLRWLLRRRFRSGQTHALCIARFHPEKKLSAALLAVPKTAYFFAAALLAFANRKIAMRNLWRGALHAGVVAYSFKPRLLLEYAKT